MATFRNVSLPKPIMIDKFLGINKATAEIETKLGEMIECTNFRITNDYKLQKVTGYEEVSDIGTGAAIDWAWQGSLGGTDMMLVSSDGTLYKSTNYSSATPTWTDTGISTTANENILYFNDAIYFSFYQKYDGTTASIVAPYIPKTFTGTPPSGGGTAFEELNMLTDKYQVGFVGNNTAGPYIMPTQNLQAVNEVKVNGVVKTVTTHYTVNLTTGQITFTAGNFPATDADVLITVTGTSTGTTNTDQIIGCRFNRIYGPGNATTVFVYGNVYKKNFFFFSGVNEPLYFPANNYVQLGSGEYSITGMKPTQNTMLIMTENNAYYTYPESNPNYTTNTGLNPYNYPVKPLNDAIGSRYYNNIELVDNKPVTIFKNQIFKWETTSVADERNAVVISERLGDLLDDLPDNVITFDYQTKKEYWLCYNGKVIVWNYYRDVFYTITTPTILQILEVGADLYLFDIYGIIYKSGGYLMNGSPVEARAVLSFSGFGTDYMNKISRKVWCAITPDSSTSLTFTYETNKKNEGEAKSYTISYALLDFDEIDFDEFTFESNRNPQIKSFKLNAKRYSFIRFIFENKLEQPVTLIEFGIRAEEQGEV